MEAAATALGRHYRNRFSLIADEFSSTVSDGGCLLQRCRLHFVRITSSHFFESISYLLTAFLPFKTLFRDIYCALSLPKYVVQLPVARPTKITDEVARTEHNMCTREQSKQSG